MKPRYHCAAIVIGLALALFGGWLVIINRHALTIPLLDRALGTIGLGIAFIAPASLTQAAQAVSAGAKTVLGALSGAKSGETPGQTPGGTPS